MAEEKEYKPYIFRSASVYDVKEDLDWWMKSDPEQCKAEYPVLSRLSLDQIDNLLQKCHDEDYDIFVGAGSLDLFELELLASGYYEEETSNG